MGLIIVGNLFLIMFEADQDAKCYPSHLNSVAECEDRSDNIQWLVIVNNILLIIYTVECLLRAFVDRGRFFCNTWNNIDLLTVTQLTSERCNKPLVSRVGCHECASLGASCLQILLVTIHNRLGPGS